MTGETIGDRIERAPSWVDRGIIKSFAEPLRENGGLVALFGNVAPRGAILKRSAADPRLFEREGCAIVFESLEDLAERIDDPALNVAPNDFLVLKNAGPASASAMPEAGYLPIPSKLAKAGVKDMVRISDARMSGTAYGTIVLHVAPDTASGGPLGLVQDGDHIRSAFGRGSSNCWSTRRNSIAARRRKPWTRRHRAAVTRGCIMSRFSRPTKAATSLFSWTVRDREGASARHIVKSGRCLDYKYAREKGRG